MLSFIVFVLVIFSAASQAFSAENQKLDRIRFGYSSISSSRIALWATNDMGFFKNRDSRPKLSSLPAFRAHRLSWRASFSSILAVWIQLPWRLREDLIWLPWQLQSLSNTSSSLSLLSKRSKI